MLEIFQNIEQTAAKLSPIALIAPGLLCVIVGLFVWLGGLGFRKLLVAIVGAVGGAICGFLFAGPNTMPVAISAGIGVIIAIIFEKLFITAMTAGLTAVFGFAVLAWLSKADFANGFKQACLQMPLYTWAIIAALAVIILAAGFYFWRLTSALCCAALGTMLVFAGMILLLLYKGAAPISYIRIRPAYFGGLFLAMMAFGTVEQLLLCPRPHKKTITKKQTSKTKETPDETRVNWRTS